MAKPLGAPSAMGRAEWRVQVFCPQDKTLAQAEFTSAEHFYKMVFSAAKPHPKPKPSASGFGLERSRKGAGEGGPHLGVPSLSGLCGDEGDDGNVSQFFVPHRIIAPLLDLSTFRQACIIPRFPGKGNGEGAKNLKPGTFLPPFRLLLQRGARAPPSVLEKMFDFSLDCLEQLLYFNGEQPFDFRRSPGKVRFLGPFIP